MRWNHRLVLASFIGMLAVGSANCTDGRLGLINTAACPYLAGQQDLSNVRISANARANVKIRAFVTAARDLTNVSMQMESEAAGACRNMARDLGVPEDRLQPASAEVGGQAKAACAALAAEIDAIFRQGVSVRVQATPPRCEANLDAKARCEGSCQVEVDPGEIVAQCEPARLSGQCEGRCGGQCDGSCQGQCQGECAAKDAQGNCAGACKGICRGRCDATCHAHCDGEWRAPKCEGHVRPPSADADCQASCKAHAEFNASCTPAQINVEGDASKAGKLIATLRANLPALLHAEFALGKRLLGDAQAVVEIGAQLPKVVGDAGAEAVACMAAASSASVQASLRIKVSVQASASVSGKVGASSG
jgi:hypothetical protein